MRREEEKEKRLMFSVCDGFLYSHFFFVVVARVIKYHFFNFEYTIAWYRKMVTRVNTTNTRRKKERKEGRKK